MLLTLMLALLLAHFLGDFVLQSNWMAINKSHRWDALQLHVSVYTLTLALIVAAALPLSAYSHTTLKLFGWFVLVNAVAHFVTDAVTSRITSRLWFVKGLRVKNAMWSQPIVQAAGHAAYTVDYDMSKRHWFFVALGADQLIHYVTLFVTAEYLL